MDTENIPSLSILQCTVCLNEYDDKKTDPRVLQCGHTICSNCVKTILSGSSKECPLCKSRLNEDSL